MSALDLDTWISLIVLVSTLSGFYIALRREIRDVRTELKSDIATLDVKLTDTRAELKSDIGRLDDRVYALAAGLRPHIEQVDPASGQ